MSCLFCQIVNGQEPSVKIFEDENFLAFLDIRPLLLGHTLLVPKQHYITLYDLPNNLIASYFTLVKKIAWAVQHGMESQGCFIAMNNIISQSIPHLHTHMVPRNKKDGLKGFFWPRMQYENLQAMQSIQNQIQKSLNLC